MTKKLSIAQAGFFAFTAIIIGFAGGNVYNAQQKSHLAVRQSAAGAA
jgi:hypothetical protein